MKKILLFFFFTVLIQAVAPAQQTMSRTFDGIETVELDINVGDLQVVRAGGRAVEVEVSYNEKDLVPEMEVMGGKLVLEEKMLRKNNTDATDWVLRIPDDTALKSSIGVGDAAFSGLSVELDHNSGVGKSTLENMSGKLKVSSGTGRIDAGASAGAFDLNSGTGAVHISGSSGTFKANSGTGSVICNGIRISGESSFNSGTGSVKAEAVAVAAESSFNSGTGSVEVQLSEALAAGISVSSGTSNAVLDFNGQPVRGRFEMECEERRGKIVAPFDFDAEEKYRDGENTIIRKTARIGGGDLPVRVSSHSGKAVVRE